MYVELDVVLLPSSPNDTLNISRTVLHLTDFVGKDK